MKPIAEYRKNNFAKKLQKLALFEFVRTSLRVTAELSCLDMEQKDAFLYFLKLSTNKQKRKNKESFRPSYSNSISLAAVRAVEWGLVIFKTSHIVRLRLCSYFASELTNFHNWSQTFLFPRFC